MLIILTQLCLSLMAGRTNCPKQTEEAKLFKKNYIFSTIIVFKVYVAKNLTGNKHHTGCA